MFLNWIVKLVLYDRRKYLSGPGRLLLALVFMVLLSAGVAGARDAAFYQQGLSPAASRLLFSVQELSRAGKYRTALDKIEQFKSGHTGKLPPLLGFVAANLNFQLENYEQAVNLYRQVVAAAPEFGQALENYGTALLQTEAYAEASRVLLQAAAMIPEKRSQLKHRAAIAALYAGDLKTARTLLVALTETSDGNPPPAVWLKALIQVEWQLSESRAALKVAGKLVDLYPDNLEHWRVYAQVAVAAGAWRQALSAYKVLQTEGRITIKERKRIAAVYQRLELFGRAAAVLEEVYTETEPGKRDLDQLATLYYQAGRIDEALHTLRLLQKLDPDPGHIFRQGEILYAAGRYREAADLFLSLDRIPKKDGHQYLMAGYCAWNLDDLPAAERAWRKAATYPAWQQKAHKLIESLKSVTEP